MSKGLGNKRAKPHVVNVRREQTIMNDKPSEQKKRIFLCI
jgi:hypothetical protein